MKGTRLKPVIRESLGQIKRELKVALTPLPRNKTWLFLVGCYNSGTTLLSEIISQHPSVSALTTEGHFITDQFVKDYVIGLPRMWVDREDIFRLNENDEGPDADRIKKEWAMRLDTSKPVLVEKSPPNTAKMRWLQKHFENAYFVGIMRNGYAVAEGISRKAEPGHLKDGWPIEKSAWQWKRSNEIMFDDAKHLDRFMWVTYEDLTEDTRGTLNKITEFVGIDNFQPFEDGRSWSIHERDEQIRNMNDDSISRLSAEQIEVVNCVAGNMLDQYGYERL